MICKIMVYCVYMRHIPFVLVVVSLSLLAGFVFVHYPKTSTSTPVPFVIEHPEVFQAFYGELVGQPAYFTFDSAKDFSLYAGLLVLEANQQDADVSLQVYRIEEDVSKNIARIEAQEERFTVVPLFTLEMLVGAQDVTSCACGGPRSTSLTDLGATGCHPASPGVSPDLDQNRGSATLRAQKVVHNPWKISTRKY